MELPARWTRGFALREGCVLIPQGEGTEILHTGPPRPHPMCLFIGGSWFVSLIIKLYNPKYHAFLSFMSHPGELLNLRSWWEAPHLQPAGQKCRGPVDPAACGGSLKGGRSGWGRVGSALTPSGWCQKRTALLQPPSSIQPRPRPVTLCCLVNVTTWGVVSHRSAIITHAWRQRCLEAKEQPSSRLVDFRN